MKTLLKEVFLVVLLVIIVEMTLGITFVRGSSMQPGIAEGDILLMDKIRPAYGKVNRGDIIVLNTNIPLPQQKGIFGLLAKIRGEKTKKIIKRVIALPGETIHITQGNVYINGELLIEDYILAPTPNEMERTLMETEYFVMGDNRLNSLDSRSIDIGPITMDKINGVVVTPIYSKKWRAMMEHNIKGIFN